MPGHKREDFDYIKALGGVYDLTELPGLDDLHHPTGVIKESQETAARLFQTKKLFYFTCGSSSGIQAAVYAACPRKSAVIVARNSHISVFNAIELNELSASYVFPSEDGNTALFLSVSPQSIEKAFRSAPDARAVIMTSPTYDGVTSDIEKIAEIAHAHGALLIVDAAHGAHLGFSPYFPDSAQSCSADIVIASLHKTLPALTGSAAVMINNMNLIERFEHAFSVFHTTSPSYPVLASIDACVHLLSERKDELFAAYETRLASLYDKAASLKNIRLLRQDTIPGIYRRDPGKILIFGNHCSGKHIYTLLREHRTEPEMFGMRHALCMTSVIDPGERFDRLYCVLKQIDSECAGSAREICAAPQKETAMKISDAVHCKKKALPLREAAGKTAAEYVYAYPPGVPALIPGDVISEEFIAYVLNTEKEGRSFHHSAAEDEETIIVCA